MAKSKSSGCMTGQAMTTEPGPSRSNASPKELSIPEALPVHGNGSHHTDVGPAHEYSTPTHYHRPK